MQKYTIKPQSSPALMRICSKCGKTTRFISSECFRVNANGRNIDVWLIYRCEKCKTTWNMTILSRVKPNQIDKELYTAFLQNDFKTAQKYSFDRSTLQRNSVTADYSMIEYEVEKQIINNDNDFIEITAFNDCFADIRLDKLLSNVMQISRSQAKQLLEENEISPSAKLREKLLLTKGVSSYDTEKL